jgi:hypothetical protein
MTGLVSVNLQKWHRAILVFIALSVVVAGPAGNSRKSVETVKGK